MTTSVSRATDTIAVELNGEPEVKGPAEDRLDNHEAEFNAYESGEDEVKPPAE